MKKASFVPESVAAGKGMPKIKKTDAINNVPVGVTSVHLRFISIQVCFRKSW